ncbi:MAG: formiminotransferase-cyclodeaminase [Anaerolineaceae bacterium]|nr:formiminotransferase-cyclodeaminase [Anaerolineaceae bacterium]
MDNYLEKPLGDYLLDAAADKPTPGGGSVAALVGALATTMASMAANFTAGKEKYKTIEPQIQARLKLLEEARGKFVELMHRDMEAYGAVMAAYRLPRGSDAESGARSEAIQAALKNSMKVPLETTEVAVGVLEAALELARIANANLLSDVAVAAILAEAALGAGRINVEVNLGGIKDAELVASTRRRLDGRQSQAGRLRQECLEAIKARSS